MQKMRSYALAIVLGLSLFGGVIGSGVINPAPTPAPMPPPTYPLQHTPPACGGPGEYACFPPTPTPCVSLCPKTLDYQVPSDTASSSAPQFGTCTHGGGENDWGIQTGSDGEDAATYGTSFTPC